MFSLAKACAVMALIVAVMGSIEGCASRKPTTMEKIDAIIDEGVESGGSFIEILKGE